MGSGASTTTTKVDRIRIDSNGDIWKKKKDGTEKICRPTSGIRPLSGIQKRIRNRSNSLHSTKSKETIESNEKLNSKVDNLKNLQSELEEDVQRLRHEIQRLEWEKAELINEVAFQKDGMRHTDDEANGFYNGHSTAETIKSQMDQKLYENLIEKLQNQLKEEQDRHQKRLMFERELREKMEDVVRIHLGDAFLFDAKNSFAHDNTLPIVKSFEGVKPFCRNLLSSHGRLSTPGNTSTNFVETIAEEPGEERSTSQAEIIRIHDDESDLHKIRPSTADVNTGAFMSPARIGRGESAPILFKRSKSREKRSQWRKKKTDGDKESIDSIDDEIDDILSGSFSSISNSIGSNKHQYQNTRSAKSRDSGYLGESANFDTDSKLDVLNLP